MKKTNNKIFYTFIIHSEQLEYLRNKAKCDFTTVTQIILDLVTEKMKSEINTIK